MNNHLKDAISPYLLQHSENPVDWYPWCDEAFRKAADEDKPVFLSIGYSTCHWCHVMARESFEDIEIAGILNRYFICIKVDKEERPDIDSVYMSVCQAFTGSGGWPTSIFMTSEQKPFFAGTYFPKDSRFGLPGLKELLLRVHDKWENDRSVLLSSADEITSALRRTSIPTVLDEDRLIDDALQLYSSSFDEEYGGFGKAPKFPAPHNLLFLLQQYEKRDDAAALRMVKETLRHMYRGGMFDHIGGGFCRYSTDRFYLVPHFEKTLYDNALLIYAYCRAYELTQDTFYKNVAEKTALYILREMTAPEGGFFSAQDADSDGREGKYYVFTPSEITSILGDKDGAAWGSCFGITKNGNFEGKSIPNLLNSNESADEFDRFLPKLREYRKSRAHLHTDDKILTHWNSLAITALCALYRISRKSEYLRAAEQAQKFIENYLWRQGTLYVTFRDGRRGSPGFLDDYASFSLALLSLYEATLVRAYLDRARQIADKAISDFFDARNGGFFLYGAENETLLLRPKESYDGALPSGNSIMTYVLVRLQALSYNEKMQDILQKQLAFMSGQASAYPAGFALFLTALSDYSEPPVEITAAGAIDELAELPFIAPLSALVRVVNDEYGAYKRLGGKATYYVCRNRTCLPPVDALDEELLRPHRRNAEKG
ncbi:MAG: thioredoxin domain-containing protein [Oscillospiraceae bacterium]|nr:thioredoxin domain-containing protein [Oscillospiraceae bacterium]